MGELPCGGDRVAEPEAYRASPGQRPFTAPFTSTPPESRQSSFATEKLGSFGELPDVSSALHLLPPPVAAHHYLHVHYSLPGRPALLVRSLSAWIALYKYLRPRLAGVALLTRDPRPLARRFNQ